MGVTVTPRCVLRMDTSANVADMSKQSFSEKQSRMQMEWLRRFQGPLTDRAAAAQAGVKERSYGNWIRRERIPAEAVLTIAGNAGLDPMRALIQTGYWDPNWDDNFNPELENSIKRAPMSDLVDEIARRIGEDSGKMIRSLLAPYMEETDEE